MPSVLTWLVTLPLKIANNHFRFFAIFSGRVEGSISRDRQSPEAALKLSSDTENDRKKVARCVPAPHRAFERVSLHDAGAAPEALRYLFETASLTLPSSFKDSLGRPAISGNAPFDPSTKNSEATLVIFLIGAILMP